jgi:hypothetical protein
MKLWFIKTRISAALDNGQGPSDWWRRRVKASDELRGIEQEMTALHRALTQSVPIIETPAFLHDSIMQAIQAADRQAPAQRSPVLLRWAPVPALALVMLLAVWWALRSPLQPAHRDAQPLAAATAALEVSGEMARTVPSAVVAPLSEELERLNLDLNNTARFLLASLP